MFIILRGHDGVKLFSNWNSKVEFQQPQFTKAIKVIFGLTFFLMIKLPLRIARKEEGLCGYCHVTKKTWTSIRLVGCQVLRFCCLHLQSLEFWMKNLQLFSSWNDWLNNERKLSHWVKEKGIMLFHEQLIT